MKPTCDGCVVGFPIQMKSCVTLTRCKAFPKQKEIHACEKKYIFEGPYVFVVKKHTNLVWRT